MTAIKVIELFAGIGAQSQSLINANVPHEIVAISEINESAIRSYAAIHGTPNNLGDITKISRLPECDLLTYSFPCQDISIAGKRKGLSKEDNTRSGLLWEVERLLTDLKERGKLPATLLMENVAHLLDNKMIGNFRKWMMKLSEFGYTSSYKVLNCKDYGLPQSRERLFMVSCLDGTYYLFPKKSKLELKIKDILENEPPQYCFIDCSYTIRKNNKKSGLMHVADIDKDGWFDQARRVYSIEGIAPTICCGGSSKAPHILIDGKVRDLSPLECWRLQGFTDEQYTAAAAVCSKKALYDQAGNTIAVNVLTAIFKALYQKKSRVMQPMIEYFGNGAKLSDCKANGSDAQ